MPDRRRQLPQSYAAKFPALARRQHVPISPIRDFSLIAIGCDQDGRPVLLEEAARLEHSLTVGATGSGKTTYYKHMALQDFRRGRGGIVLDPHGSHPGSLYHELIIELSGDGFFDAGRVHLIDPNIRSHVVPINFLARLDDTDICVIADALLAAVERVWGDEDTQQKPTIRTVLKATFATLAELGLPLTDAKLLFDPHDRSGFRANVITKLSNEYARDELERLHTTALDERSKRDFRAEVVGPINRLNEFASSEVLSAMLGIVDEPGKPRRTLDLLEIMNKGHIVLVNLQHGPAVSEADTNLLGAMLLRYVFLLASRRNNREPFMLFVDECHRYLTGDVPSILAEARKFGIATHLALQFMAQAGKPDDLTYQALLNSTAIKTLFQIRCPDEAQRLAPFVIDLNLERPVSASIRPTVVGHRRTNLSSSGTSTEESETEGHGETVADMHARTAMHSRGTTKGTMTTTAIGAGEFSAVGDSAGIVMAPAATLFGPNAPNATFLQMPTSQSIGQSASRGSSQQSATSTGTSEVSIETEGEAETYARSYATSTSHARTRGRGTSTGQHEAFEPIYADLPSAWHSKEHELHKAGELLRHLPVGRAFVSWRGTSVCITVPQAKRKS